MKAPERGFPGIDLLELCVLEETAPSLGILGVQGPLEQPHLVYLSTRTADLPFGTDSKK
jgi:hypothetical protein